MPDSPLSQTAALATRGRSEILAVVPAGIFETDADGQCRFVNRRWQAYTGLSAENALGSGWIEAIHPGDRETVVAEWRAAVLVGREFALEFRFLRPDGTTMWAAGNASPIRDVNGPVTGFIGTVTDVSAVVEERRQQGDERRFVDAVLDIAAALVCVFDGEGRILRFNRACELVTGYSIEDVRGRPFYEIGVPVGAFLDDGASSIVPDLLGILGRRSGDPSGLVGRGWSRGPTGQALRVGPGNAIDRVLADAVRAARGSSDFGDGLRRGALDSLSRRGTDRSLDLSDAR